MFVFLFIVSLLIVICSLSGFWLKSLFTFLLSEISRPFLHGFRSNKAEIEMREFFFYLLSMDFDMKYISVIGNI